MSLQKIIHSRSACMHFGALIFTLKAAVTDAIDNPKFGLNKNDSPAKYPAGNAYKAESCPLLRHRQHIIAWNVENIE